MSRTGEVAGKNKRLETKIPQTENGFQIRDVKKKKEQNRVETQKERTVYAWKVFAQRDGQSNLASPKTKKR